MTLPVYEVMVASRETVVPAGDAWVHEVKWDGIRALVSGDGSIRSRKGNRIEGAYPELLRRVPSDAVVDGEIVAFDETGRPSFQTLQARMHVRRPASELVTDVPVTFMAFDLLHLGEPLVDRPWEERRHLLESLRLEGPVVVTDLHEDGMLLHGVVVELDLEGVVSKRRSSPYRVGRRSDDWRKVVNRKTCEAVVVGSTAGTGGRSGTFGSLAVALWLPDGTLRYVGSVGSGFDGPALGAIDAALGEMEVDVPPPLEDPALVPAPVRWVTPSLVAVVEYASWTNENRLRAPVFKGFSASPVEDVTWEREGPG